MEEYEVTIIEKKTRKVIKRMSSLSLSKAIRVQRGATINLNRKTHCVEINAMRKENI